MSSLTTTATPSTQLTATLAELSDELTTDVQADFIERLAQWGNVRAAARAAGLSRAQFYRMRRANPLFATMWDAALLLARPRVEEVLADRALNGVTESVFYHGEAVATRTRYDSRLLLAHLGRLDRIEQDREVLAAARDFDDLLETLRNPAADHEAADDGDDAWDDDADYVDTADDHWDSAKWASMMENGRWRPEVLRAVAAGSAAAARDGAGADGDGGGAGDGAG